MGLSSSKSKVNEDVTRNTTDTQNVTTAPVTPDWLSQAAQDYVSRIGSFGNMDPNSFVAPGSPLQNMAWQNADQLGGWRPQSATASQLAYGAGTGGPNFAGTGGAMGRYGSGLNPVDARLGGGGAQGGGPAQMPASSLGGSDAAYQQGQQLRQLQQQAEASSLAAGPSQVKTMPSHPGELARPVDQSQLGSPGAPPQNAFSGASSLQGGYQQPQGEAFQQHAYGYDAPQLNAPGLVSGQGYSAPQLGSAGGYAAARTGSPIGAEAQGCNPAGMTPAGVAPSTQATAYSATPESMLTNLNYYQNPYNDQVRNTALSDYDNNAAQQRAQLEARGAAAGAFGGSRFGIAQGQFEGDQLRGRASLEAGLLDQGFGRAAALSVGDTANRQQSNLFNAGNQTGISQFNAGTDAQRALAQAGFVQQSGLANQQSQNDASAAGAAARNASQLQYADNAARYGLDYAGRSDSASQFGLNLGQQRDITQAGFNADAGRYAADSGMQAALANQNMAGQFGLAQGQLGAQAGLFNAGNRTAVSGANALANNQMSQFNAQQGDNFYNRQLQAAGMLGNLANDYGSGTRADLGLMGQFGDQQRAIEQAYAGAGPAQLELMGRLSGMTPYDILVGRNVNGTSTGTMTGTGQTTTTQSPSLFSIMQGLGNTAARVYAGGMGQ